MQENGFKHLVRSWWQGFNFRSSSSFLFSEKIKALKPFIRAWNKDVFGWVEVNKEEALKRIGY